MRAPDAPSSKHEKALLSLKPAPRGRTVRLMLSETTAARLNAEARRLRAVPRDLVSALLTVVLKDKLVDALLDGKRLPQTETPDLFDELGD